MNRPAGILLVLVFLARSASAAERVAMQPIHHLRKGTAAWRLISAPRTQAERNVNDYLMRLNQKLASTLKECDKNYAEAMEEGFGKKRMGGELTRHYDRDVLVTMRGPRYLSEVANVTFYCGGAHPYTFTDVAVFDLDTGEPVDPRTWFTPAADVSGADESPRDPGLEPSTVFPALIPVYEELTGHDCDEVFEKSQPFLIWPDAQTGRVMVQADDLPGAMGACGTPAGLSPDQAHKLGVDEALLKAIDQAHRNTTAPPHPAKP